MTVGFQTPLSDWREPPNHLPRSASDNSSASFRRIVQPALPAVDGYTVPPGGLSPWRFRRAVAYVEANIAGDLRIGDIAQLLRLSQSHFCKSFKNSFGRPPYDYILERRVARAMRSMANLDLPLKQIAVSSGFSDQAHFSRVFRQVIGMPPSEWRRHQDRAPS